MSIEGLAHQFKAVFQSLEPGVRHAVDNQSLYAAVIQQVVSRNARNCWGFPRNIPDDYGTQLISDWAEVYKDSLCFRMVVEQAIVFCVKDFYSSYSSEYGRYISHEYINKQVARVIPEHY